MPIVDGWIQGLAQQPLAHQGGQQTGPKLLVIHYSVTDTIQQAVTALNNHNPPLSYHILIGKDGRAVQTRPFTQTAAHPGRSNWKDASGVRDASTRQVGSIGVCLMNMGFAHGPRPHAPGQLVYAPKQPGLQTWEIYPQAQIAACQAICREIIGAYPIREAVGHHDIAIMGKFDPGPLFNLAALQAMIAPPPPIGFPTSVHMPGGTLPLRRERDPNGQVLRQLPHGAPLHIRSVAYGPPSMSLAGAPNTPANQQKRWITAWASVDVDSSNRHAGFVHMRGLAATPLHPNLAARLPQAGPA